jgi:hypothetical protein
MQRQCLLVKLLVDLSQHLPNLRILRCSFGVKFRFGGNGVYNLKGWRAIRPFRSFGNRNDHCFSDLVVWYELAIPRRRLDQGVT